MRDVIDCYIPPLYGTLLLHSPFSLNSYCLLCSAYSFMHNIMCMCTCTYSDTIIPFYVRVDTTFDKSQ